jgi:hypothetical protein
MKWIRISGSVGFRARRRPSKTMPHLVVKYYSVGAWIRARSSHRKIIACFVVG